jgi:hypothetical protein
MTIKNIDLINMIDEGFEDFEAERNKRKNIKLLLDFSSSDILHDRKSMNMDTKPKYKQKLLTNVYIKNKKNNNSLF